MRKPMTNTFPQIHPGHTGAVAVASDFMAFGFSVSGIDRIQILPAIQPHEHTCSVVEGSDDILTTCFTEAINGDYKKGYRLRAIGRGNGATPRPDTLPRWGSLTPAQTQAEIVRAKGL